MGISSLWKALTDAQLVRRLQGSDPEEHAALLSELDGQVLAVDLSAWIMQADQQLALLPHFSRTERCMKVALERSIQWLRHGVLPVMVVEGAAPAEKLAAVQARYAARTGGRQGGGRGSSSFQVLGKAVGVMLQQLVSGRGAAVACCWGCGCGRGRGRGDVQQLVNLEEGELGRGGG